MDILDLYKLSLTEPIDVIEAMDHEKAEIIKKFNEAERLRAEVIASGVTVDTYGMMRRAGQLCSLGMDIGKLFTRTHWGKSDYDLIRAANDGKSTFEIAEETMLSPGTIEKKIRDAGFRYSKTHKRWIEPVKWTAEDMVTLADNGYTVREISRRFSIRTDTVSDHLRSAGYTYVHAHKRWEKQSINVTIGDLANAGYDANQIAKRLNITPPVVRQTLRELGFKWKGFKNSYERTE